jgi:hypothetical protein
MATNGKFCIKCHEYKDIALFFKNKSSKDGYLNTCKLCHVAQKKEIIKKNSLYYKSKRRERYILHRDESIRLAYEWNCKNKQRFNDNKKKYVQNHPEIFKSVSHRLRHAVSSGIRRILAGKKNGIKWSSLVGYGTEELKKHIEQQFTEMMSWENYGMYWEIDHIIPVASFKINTPTDVDFKKCWALSNLRPLSVSENRSKKNNIVSMFGT